MTWHTAMIIASDLLILPITTSSFTIPSTVVNKNKASRRFIPQRRIDRRISISVSAGTRSNEGDCGKSQHGIHNGRSSAIKLQFSKSSSVEETKVKLEEDQSKTGSSSDVSSKNGTESASKHHSSNHVEQSTVDMNDVQDDDENVNNFNLSLAYEEEQQTTTSATVDDTMTQKN